MTPCPWSAEICCVSTLVTTVGPEQKCCLYCREFAGEHGERTRGQRGDGRMGSRGAHEQQELEMRCRSPARLRFLLSYTERKSSVPPSAWPGLLVPCC